MRKAMPAIVRLELENLLCKRVYWILAAAYALFAAVICLSDNFRKSYFYDTESVPAVLLDMAAPFFLTASLIAVLSPVFAGDREQGIEQIPAVCLAGSRGRNIGKTLAAVFFSLISCGMFGGITLFITFICGKFDPRARILYIGTKPEFAGEWPQLKYISFSFICLMAGGVVLALAVLYISYISANTISAIAAASFFILFEFLFNRFSFPLILKEYNLWVFLRPRYLFAMGLLHFSPERNLAVMTAVFLPVCALAVRRITAK